MVFPSLCLAFLLIDTSYAQALGTVFCDYKGNARQPCKNSQALTAVNVAQVEQDVKADTSFLISDNKTLIYKNSMLERFAFFLPKDVELNESDTQRAESSIRLTVRPHNY